MPPDLAEAANLMPFKQSSKAALFHFTGSFSRFSCVAFKNGLAVRAIAEMIYNI